MFDYFMDIPDNAKIGDVFEGVVRSAAGFYVGSVVIEEWGPSPNARYSGYYRTREEAEKAAVSMSYVYA